jgi:hypothetical protein
MSAIEAIFILVFFGAAVWALVTYIPMNAGLKKFIIVFAIICAAFFIADITGILGDIKSVKVPKVN